MLPYYDFSQPGRKFRLRVYDTRRYGRMKRTKAERKQWAQIRLNDYLLKWKSKLFSMRIDRDDPLSVKTANKYHWLRDHIGNGGTDRKRIARRAFHKKLNGNQIFFSKIVRKRHLNRG